MKYIFKYLAILSVVLITFSCDKNPDNVIYELDPNALHGAVLRTISIESDVLNSSNPTSEFKVIIEEQDVEDGALMESVDVYVSIRDLTPDNGTTPPSEAKLKTIAASEFTVGPVGLPRTTVSATFAEATSAMGLSSDDYAPGDVYVFEFSLNLTDGRIFDSSSSSNVLSGIYFNSPFKYNALISCSPEPGTYRLDMQDAYGDGWQSNGMAVSIDGVVTNYGAGSQNGGTDFYTSSVDIVVPVGTESLTWNWPGDSYANEVSFQIYAPDGSVLGVFVGTDPPADYGCGCSITSVNGIDATVAEPGLQPILLCAE